MSRPKVDPVAIGLAFVASFLWAAYYPFIVVVPASWDGAVLAFPFLFGALPLLALNAIRGLHGKETSPLSKNFLGMCLLGGAFMALLQLDVILSTRAVGAVLTAIFTLLGDVVAIPLFSFLLWREGASRVLSWKFWLGAAVAAAGALLAIVGGGGDLPLGWRFLALELPIPLLVGAYFALVAQMTQKARIDQVVGPVTLSGFVLSLLFLPLLGGPGQLVAPPAWVYVDLLAVGLTTFFIAPWAFFGAGKRVSIVIPSVVNATIPIFTLLLMVGLLGTAITPLEVLGIPIAFGGAFLAILS